MNSDTLQGTWNQIKGNVKEAFGKLTDDDMMKMEGSMDRAVGVLQQRYGYTKEQAQQEWDKFMSRYNRDAKSVAANTETYLRDASDRLNNAADGLANKKR